MDLVNIQPYLKPSDDFILLGSTHLEMFESIHQIVHSFTILERDEARVIQLQNTHNQAFALKNIDDALDFFIEEMNEIRLPNVFVYVNPCSSAHDTQFYRQIEMLLTGRSFYSLELHFSLLGHKLLPEPQLESKTLHLKDGLRRLDRKILTTAEQHLFHILDEINR
jgi:hypothetical protein